MTVLLSALLFSESLLVGIRGNYLELEIIDKGGFISHNVNSETNVTKLNKMKLIFLIRLCPLQSSINGL